MREGGRFSPYALPLEDFQPRLNQLKFQGRSKSRREATGCPAALGLPAAAGGSAMPPAGRHRPAQPATKPWVHVLY